AARLRFLPHRGRHAARVSRPGVDDGRAGDGGVAGLWLRWSAAESTGRAIAGAALLGRDRTAGERAHAGGRATPDRRARAIVATAVPGGLSTPERLAN